MINFKNIIFFSLYITSSNLFGATVLHLQGDVEHVFSYPDGVTYTDSDGTFDATTIIWSPLAGLPVGNTVEIDYTRNNSTFSVPNWALEFSAPDDESLHLGLYDNIYRNPFHRTNGLHQAGFSLSSGHSGCNSVGGDFTILEIGITNNLLTSFAADFTFICNPGTGNQVEIDHEIYRDAELHGSVRINSEIPLTTIPVPPSIILFISGLAFLSRIKKNITIRCS